MDLARRHQEMPLHRVKEWNPFKIDALGLVTLLGAEEVNKSIGALQRRRYTEYLPLLAAFLIAGDRFTDEQPGHSLYNLTDGIHTTELKGWFTRWLSSQDVEETSTSIFRWYVEENARKPDPGNLIAPVLSLVTVTPLLVFTVLIGDWFGVGNCIAIVVSIMVRIFLLSERRRALEKAAIPDPKNEDDREVKTLFVTRADGKMVTIYAPQSVVMTFTRDFELHDKELYHFVRWVGWAAFGAHICILGMSTLFTQIYTVVLLVFSTWLLCSDLSWDIGRHVAPHEAGDGLTSEYITSEPFGSWLQVEQENPTTKSRKDMGRRLWAYVRAEPTPEQDRMLQQWTLLPFESNKRWHAQYHEAKESYAEAKSMYAREKTVQAEKSGQSVVETASAKSSASFESARPGATRTAP